MAPALVTVTSAYLPTRAVAVSTSTTTNVPLGDVTLDCQVNSQPPLPSVNVVRLVVAL